MPIQRNVPGWTVSAWRTDPKRRPTWRGINKGRPGYWRVSLHWVMIVWWRR